MILLHESKKASFALRLATLLALTLMFAFTALVALDNRELHKVLPHSWLRSYAMLFGYAVGILSASYATALRGRNFIGWKDPGLSVQANDDKSARLSIRALKGGDAQ